MISYAEVETENVIKNVNISVRRRGIPSTLSIFMSPHWAFLSAMPHTNITQSHTYSMREGRHGIAIQTTHSSTRKM